MKFMKDVAVKDKVILLRADFNVPMKGTEIQEDSRIRKTLPTIMQLLEDGAEQVIILSHFGRPKGAPDKQYSLQPVFDRLVELLPDIRVGFVDDCLKDATTDKVVLMENTRFYKEEKLNDASFAKKLAHGADVFVFDAFGTAHRDHASTTGVAAFIPETCFGLLMEKELQVLMLDDIPTPFKAIIGAAKVSDKIPVLESLLHKVDKVLLGGAIVFTFLKALGYEVGTSLVEESELARAKKMYEEHQDKIVLPVDIVVSEEVEGHDIFTVAIDKIPANMKGLDIGDESIALFKETLDRAGTIFWNGPLGLFEVPPFDHATNEIAQYLSDSKKITIVGGGDTEKAIIDAGVAQKFTHISTGGGASLELIAGHKLVVLEKLGK